jgi:pSer/pThr/pTyr-binding forkhead associated (FHA) protein
LRPLDLLCDAPPDDAISLQDKQLSGYAGDLRLYRKSRVSADSHHYSWSAGVLRKSAAGYYVSRPTAIIDGYRRSKFEGNSGMSDTIDRRELTFKALAGLVGGAIGWLPVEIADHGQTLNQATSTGQRIGDFVAMALMAGVIGGLIVAAEGTSLPFVSQPTFPFVALSVTPQAKRRFLRGFILCFILSFPANYCANGLFNWILQISGWNPGQPGFDFSVVIARTLGWALMGAMLGVGVGLSTLSLGNVVKGFAGGWVGGFVGGLLFDLIGIVSQSGWTSRLVTLSAIGLSIGLFIGFVQELTKAAWLAIEAGRLRGRQYRIEGVTAMMGRAEENPIGLFGDPGVQPRHAVISRQGANFSIRNLAVQEGTFVNGNRIETVELHDGDRIRISNYEMSFHSRAGAQAAAARMTGAPYPTGPSPMASATVTGSPSLAAAPAMGAEVYLAGVNGDRFVIRSGATTRIGRALDNDIVVTDASVSRHHATIETSNGSYRLRDLGSQNGTFVGGERITEASLGNGAAVRIGDAAFTFHG